MGDEAELKTNIIMGDILITHGDIVDRNIAMKSIKNIIIGHEHPSIVLQSGVRSEKYKCFLKGKYKKKILIVMPSSNTLIEGSDVLREKFMSPYLRDISKFEIFAIGDKIYDFGTVKDVIKRTKNSSF